MFRFEALLIGGLVCIGGLALSACRSGGPVVRQSQVPAPGVSLYVRVAGNPESGNVLIAINGGPGFSSHYMLDLEQFVGSDFAVVTYDQRGTGRSGSVPPQAAHFDLLKYVEDLEAVRETTGADKVHLLGHSWGGLVAMRYATLYPERVDSMVLVGSAPPTWQGLASGFERINARIQQLEQVGLILARMPGCFLSPRPCLSRRATRAVSAGGRIING